MNQTESSKVMQVKNNSQRKLLYDFFQAEEQRRQKKEALNRAKAEMSEALAVYYKFGAISGFISGFVTSY